MAYLKSRPAWIQLLLYIGMAFGIGMIFTFIGDMILKQLTGISTIFGGQGLKFDAKNPNTVVYLRGMQVVQFIGLFLIPTLLFAYYSDPHPVNYLGLKKQPASFYFLAGIALMVVAIPFAGWLGELNRQVHFSASADKWMKDGESEAAAVMKMMLNKNSVKDLLINLFVVALLAGVGEELVFRGILQRLFIRWFKNAWVGIIITAVLFSAIHMQFYGFLPRMALGILLGAIYFYSGSLWAAILAHFFYDALILTIIHFNPAQMDSDSPALTNNAVATTVVGLVSLALSILIIWYMKKKSNVRYDDIYKNDHRDYNNPFEFEK
jgi:uncharacterized protein